MAQFFRHARKASSTILFISPLTRNTTKTSILMPSLRFISVVPCTHVASVRYYSSNSASSESFTINFYLPNSRIREVTISLSFTTRYSLTVAACVDKLMQLRDEFNSYQQATGGKRISVNDLVIKTATMALLKVSECNSSWMNDLSRMHHTVNVNVAMQTDNGLIVPVIKDTNKKGLATIAEDVEDLAKNAKENILKSEDYEGGTFTVSNLGGPFELQQFSAIINPPQSCILAVGSVERGANTRPRS